MATAPKTSSSGGALLLDEVDDYLAPSQACINPLFQPKDEKKIQDGSNKVGEVGTGGGGSNGGNVVIPRRKRRTIRRAVVDAGGGNIPSTTTTTTPSSSTTSSNESNNKKDEDPVKASMADCLACSGCVTTAETVLLEQEHSLEKLRAKCLEQSRNQHHVVRVLTISPSSWADLFRHLNISKTISATAIQQLQRQIVTLMNQAINVNVIIDGILALQWSLDEAAKEFCEMYTTKKTNNDGTPTTKHIPDPSIPIDSTQTTYYSNGAAIIKINDEQPFQNSLPLISGSCPAVVCLVEKSKQSLVTNLATSKSPMAMTGAILRETLLLQQQHQNGGKFDFDHWAIMPCHDKKLEASRKDFTHRNSSTIGTSTTVQKDIELVIATKEWYHLIRDWVSSKLPQQHNSAIVTNAVVSTTNDQILDYIQSLPVADIIYDKLPSGVTTAPVVFATSKASIQSASSSSSSAMAAAHPMVPLSSGGHADFIFRYAARQLFQCHLDPNVSIWKPATGRATQNSTGVIRSARMAKRNKLDYYEAILYRHRGGNEYCYSIDETDSLNPQPVLRFAIANGLQTLQRVFSSLGIEAEGQEQGSSISVGVGLTSRFDYVEAMACPSGCVNGGGQLRVNDDNANTYQATTRETPTQTRQRVAETQEWLKLTSANGDGSTSSTLSDEMMDTSDDVVQADNMDTDFGQADAMMDIDGDGAEHPSQKLSSRRTRYHVVPQMKYGLGAAAGVAVEDIQW